MIPVSMHNRNSIMDNIHKRLKVNGFRHVKLKDPSLKIFITYADV